MGADTFYTVADGKTPQAAFNKAVKQALWDNGHAGYTGTIAEKDCFTIIRDVPAELKDKPHSADDIAEYMIRTDDERISDKWGPAGCIVIKPGKHYLFFGLASS